MSSLWMLEPSVESGMNETAWKLIADMGALDRQAIDSLEIPGLLLMEAAGEQVARTVVECRVKRGTQNIMVVCGRGNNGGDGFVCARKLSGLAERITVVHTAPPETLKGDALLNFTLLQHYPVEVVHCQNAEAVSELILQADVVVDALFGSGLARPVAGLEADLIRLINSPAKSREQRVVAIDLPSGVDGRTGQVLGGAVKADVTVTLAAGKPGLYLHPGKSHAGRVKVVDIGIPPKLLAADPSPIRLTTEGWVRSVLPQPSPDSHKYTIGSALVLAGSRDMPGAAALAANTAMSAGAGMVTLAAPQSVFSQVQLMPEVIHCPLPETPEGRIRTEAMGPVLEALDQKKCRAIAIGPGLGQSPEVTECLRQLLETFRREVFPVVLDADGLNALSGLLSSRHSPEALLGQQMILTPHLGECVRLTGFAKTVLEEDLLEGAKQAQRQLFGQLVLKSATTVTAGTDGLLWINPTGNVGMATAGSGDVLTGIIVALAAQGMSAGQAAICGPFIHGLAGDLAAEVLGVQTMTAGDISRFLSQAFQTVSGAAEVPVDGLYSY